MAAYVVSGDQYREIDRQMIAIKRELSEHGGSRLDPDVVARRLQLILDAPTAAPTGSTEPDEAAAIMGPAFHGLDELVRLLGIDPSPVETAQLAAIPFSPDTLARSRETHLLVACTRFSVMGLRAKAPDAFYFNKAWYADEDFARRALRPRWRLIRKEPVPESTSKSWPEQRQALPGDELVPGACEVALAMLLHYLATGERLLRSVYVRTRDLDSAGRRVGIGRFGPDGLRIRSFGEHPDYYLGLAAARKSSWHRGNGAITRTARARPWDRRRSAPQDARGS